MNPLLTIASLLAVLDRAANLQVVEDREGCFFTKPTFRCNHFSDPSDHGPEGEFLWVTTMDGDYHTFKVADNELVELNEYGHLILTNSRGQNVTVQVLCRMDAADILAIDGEMVEA